MATRKARRPRFTAAMRRALQKQIAEAMAQGWKPQTLAERNRGDAIAHARTIVAREEKALATPCPLCGGPMEYLYQQGVVICKEHKPPKATPYYAELLGAALVQVLKEKEAVRRAAVAKAGLSY